MNIVLLSDHFLPTIGGGEFITHYWAESLTRRGHKVIIPAFKPFLRPYKETMKFTYNVDRFPYLPYLEGLCRTIHFGQINRNHRVDIIHANFVYPPGSLGVYLQDRFNIPCVVSGQGADILSYAPLRYGNLGDVKIKKKSEKVIRQAAGLIYNCEAVRRIYIELGGQENRMFKIFNGTPFHRIRSEKRKILRERHHIKDDSIVFLSVSRNTPIKGLPLVIQALSQCPDKQNIHYLIIGPQTEKLKEMIDRYYLGDIVTVLGEMPLESDPKTGIPLLPSQAIIDYLYSSDVYVSPALSGTFELSAADAMSAGLAVIVSDNVGNKDVVQNGINGYVFENNNPTDLADKLSLIIRERKRIPVIGNKNRLLAEKLDWDEIALQLESVYKQTIAFWSKYGKK